MSRAARLELPVVDAEVHVASRGLHSQEAGVGVNNLHYVGVVPGQPEGLGRVLLYEGSCGVQAWAKRRTLMMEATSTREMSENLYQTTPCKKPGRYLSAHQHPVNYRNNNQTRFFKQSGNYVYHLLNI